MRRRHDESQLQVNQDLVYQKREWIFERAGWILLGSIILVATLGFFGAGPFNSGEVIDHATGIRIDYDRRLHYSAESALRMEIPSAFVKQDEIHVWIAKDYLDRVFLKEIDPQPTRIEAGSDGHTFVFRVAALRDAVPLLFRIEPEKPGDLNGRIAIGGQSLNFEQFVYP